MSHTITSVRETKNIQTNEGQEVNIYDVAEANHTRRYDNFLNKNKGIRLYAIPEKTR